MSRKIDEEVNGVYTTPKQRPEEESEDGVQVGGASASQTGGTSAVRSSGDPYEVAMNAHHQNGGTQGSGGGGAINSSVLPTGDSGSVGGGSAAVGTGGSTPDGDDDIGYKDTYTESERHAQQNPRPAPLTEEEEKKAARKDRRAKRVGIASRLMDTMARLVNFGTAAAGGPAAKWGPLREGAPTTYLASLRKQNADAIEAWENGHNSAYNLDLLRNKQGREQARKDWEARQNQKNKEADRNQKQPLIDADVENKNADTENKKAQAESQRIRNQYLPSQLKAENEETRARAAEHVASANKTAGRGVYKIYAGNGKDDVYHNETEWQDHLTQEATDLGINLRDYLTTTTRTSGRNGGETVTEKEQDKIDWSKVAGAIRQKKMVLEEE